jgi:isopenicillin N synthase-like dioxygenase
VRASTVLISHILNQGSGYARLNENITNSLPDAHEGIDFYRPVASPDPSKPIWGTNQWPDIPNFREAYQEWTERMQVLGKAVMHA